MKTYRNHRTSIGHCALAGILFSFGPNLLVGGGFVEAGRSEDAIPEGLTDSDWKSIHQEYERHRHASVAVDGGFRARNPGQQWLTHFDGRGFNVEPAIAGVEPEGAGWRWGLELRSYGFPGHEQAVHGPAKVTAQNDRVTYDWDFGVREWFVNDRRGLEHGFTLVDRPPGAGDPQLGASDWLELRLAVRGGLRPQVQADGRGVSFVDGQGHAVVHYTGLKVWDADRRELPARFDCEAGGLRLAVDERHARYPLTIDPIAQQAYLKASNTGEIDFFGSSVAVSGDTVVVGASLEDSNATGVDGNQADNSASASGTAYVFVRNVGGNWSQQAYLKASNTGANDEFGFSVAVSGDTIVIGAHHESSNATGVNGNQTDNSAPFSGAAYVFVRDGGGNWSQQAYLKASNTNRDDEFGFSVAVSGDTVVIGAWEEGSNATGVNGNQADNSASQSGAAYVFVRDGGGNWSQQAYLKASNTGAFDIFGWSVAVSGDTVVVGARQEDSNATGVNGNQADNSASQSGAAYVFVRDGGGNWSQQAYLKASNTGGGDDFGRSVAASGENIVVGASLEDSNATGVNGNQADNSANSSGAVYVFVRDGGGNWSQEAYLKASNTGGGDTFGRSVAVSGDTVVVGAWQESSNATGVNGNQADNSASGSGAAYVFVRDAGGNWSQQAYLKASNTGSFDNFGEWVAVSGDTVVVGAPGEDSNATGVNGNQADNNASNSGAAYVFVLGPTVCGDGTVDSGEECDDGNMTNGDCCSSTCTFECAATECRPSTGVCDVAENCTGSSGECPSDGFAPSTTECRASAGACDVAEFCDGAGNCPDDGFQTNTFECRASTDECDPAESCTGSSATCPADSFNPDGTLCAPDVNECTDDVCTGGVCTHPNSMAGTACGIMADRDCDNPDTCDGSGNCQSNNEPGTTECRPSAGICDVAESCDGAGNCPADGFQPSTFECRVSTGECDPAESCTGSSATCPADAFDPDGTACTADVNECTDDVCTGGVCTHPNSMTGTACGSKADTDCDNPDTCDGNGTCQPNNEPSTTMCRPVADVCDVAESCDGAGNCPADAFEPSSTECRAAASDCDVAENCTGSGADCPADELAPGGTPCDDADACTIDDICSGGQCMSSFECRLYADVVAEFCLVDVDDLLCVLDDFVNPAFCTGDGDVFPCDPDGTAPFDHGDGINDVDDISAVLQAFVGFASCPDPCPP